MKQTIDNSSQFSDAFRKADRQDQFSQRALEALFDYLEENDPDYELDVIGLCCEWSEYGEAAEAASEYGWEGDADSDGGDNEQEALEWLQDRTTVIEFDGGVLIAQF